MCVVRSLSAHGASVSFFCGVASASAHARVKHIDIVYPLYMFKKETVSKITWAVYPLSQWVAIERKNDSVAAVITREVIVEEVLDSLARVKRK